jgi:hypothetical protein
MSLLHKYDKNNLINLIKIMNLFTTEEGSSLNLIIARDSGLVSKPKLNLLNLQIYRLRFFI